MSRVQSSSFHGLGFFNLSRFFLLLGINFAAVYHPEKNLTLAAQALSAAIGMVCVFLATRKKR